MVLSASCLRSWYDSHHLSVCLRWTYQEFFSRYRVLMKQKDVLPDKKLTCRNVLEKLVQVRKTNFSSIYDFRSVHNTDFFPFLSLRTRINTSLVRPKYSSEQGKLPTWRSWGRTSCALPASASRKPSDAGWHARSICASAMLPSPSRGSPEDTRLAGECTSSVLWNQWLLLLTVAKLERESHPASHTASLMHKHTDFNFIYL